MSIKCIQCFYFGSFLLTLKLPFDAHDSIAMHHEIPLKINTRSMFEDNDKHIVNKNGVNGDPLFITHTFSF